MFRVLLYAILLVLAVVFVVNVAANKAVASDSINVSASKTQTRMVPVVIDGNEVDGKAAVIDGEVYLPLSLLVKAQGKTVRYESDLKQVIIGKNSSDSSRLDVKPVLEVVMSEPECKEMVESLGLEYNSSVSIPETLHYYSCVILNNNNATKPSVSDRLKKYLSEGGGVVLVGSIPLKLDTEGAKDYDYVFDGKNTTLKKLPSIVDWFGCNEIISLQCGPWRSGGVMLTSTNRTLGTNLGMGTTIFRHVGSQHLAVLDVPDEFCEIVAAWRSEKYDQTGIAAFVHTYGKGRVYWQSLIDDPNYPKLKELFRAGIWRAVTGKNLPSSSIFGSGGD
ncbi:MAG: hypothetical protein GX139_00735 [Armatimonadetes bacterium]|jgi:hypothetical protein|nr:hypothetical protein [Armatimonadota bacterium]